MESKSNTSFRYILLFLIFSIPEASLSASGYIPEDSIVDRNIEKVKGLVSFLQFTLNTIGDIKTTPAEKDIIITQSYLKFFRDPEVQIEDDLDPNRQVVTNKDVQAYLKDVDFFFKICRFTFDIQSIESIVNNDEGTIYLARFNRNLSAVTIDDDTINQNIIRYVEINLENKTNDLKIVSYYTTKLSEEENLLNWWVALNFEWRMFFINRFNLTDTVTSDDILKIWNIDSIDISENPYITDLLPLAKCERLQYLNIKNTYINDLSPLRYLSKLHSVDISGTPANEINSLHYSLNIRDLNLSNTEISDFSILNRFVFLQTVNLANTSISDLSAFTLVTGLKRLVLSGTNIESLSQLSSLNNLEYLDISSTAVESLQPLSSSTNLKQVLFENTVIDDLFPLSFLPGISIINCESSNVHDLTPLLNTKSLRKIYCDNSGVTRITANAFNSRRPEVLVIFESQLLEKWWSSLTPAWKEILLEKVNSRNSSGKEDLAKIVSTDSISLNNKKEITNLSPLSVFRNLTYINCHNTNVSDLSPLDSLEVLRSIDLSSTLVNDLSILKEFKKLIYLDIQGSQVKDISALKELRGLLILVADHTGIPEEQIRDLVKRNPEAQVIYRTDSLFQWWNSLDDKWKNIFYSNLGVKTDTFIDKWFLHKVNRLEKIFIDSVMISDLAPLLELNFMRTLIIQRTTLTNIKAIARMESLTRLTINRAPVSDFTPIRNCNELEDLDLSNTVIDDLSILTGLRNLKKLILSSTRIKNIEDIRDLNYIKQLDISNTKIRNLKPLSGYKNLRLLVCFNTLISSKSIDIFRKNNPECELFYY
jgi:hypothetical protein